MAEIIINDDNFHLHLPPSSGGIVQRRGLIPRDYATHPPGCYACATAFDIPLIPESEWEDRLAAQKAAKAQLSDIRNRSGPNGGPIPSRDQNGRGYCWAHSSVSAMLIARAVQGQPFADLSAYMVACIIKNFRDEGGWGAESVEWMAENGCATAEDWPQQGTSRKLDTPEMRERAKHNRFTEWMELGNRNKAQLVTCLLLGIPVVSDFNWWRHSVLTLDLVSLNPFRTRIWNSWSDSWSENGTGILEGSKAIPDDALAPRVVTASKG